MSRAPLLVLDEALDARLAGELSARGREAVSVATLDLRGSGDAALLRGLTGVAPAWVLVTADDALPATLRSGRGPAPGAVAVVDADQTGEWPLAAWRREVVHRWAHVMQAQDRGSARRYGLTRHSAWRPRLPERLA